MITKRAFNSASWHKAMCQWLVVALALPLAAMTLTPQTAQAGKDNPKAQGSLLKHAQEHPNDTDPRHRAERHGADGAAGRRPRAGSQD